MISAKRIVGRMKKTTTDRPRCRAIEPDSGAAGYFCRTCGMELIPRGSWWVHGARWLYPERWYKPEFAQEGGRLGDSR